MPVRVSDVSVAPRSRFAASLPRGGWSTVVEQGQTSWRQRHSHQRNRAVRSALLLAEELVALSAIRRNPSVRHAARLDSTRAACRWQPPPAKWCRCLQMRNGVAFVPVRVSDVSVSAAVQVLSSPPRRGGRSPWLRPGQARRRPASRRARWRPLPRHSPGLSHVHRTQAGGQIVAGGGAVAAQMPIASPVVLVTQLVSPVVQFFALEPVVVS